MSTGSTGVVPSPDVVSTGESACDAPIQRKLKGDRDLCTFAAIEIVVSTTDRATRFKVPEAEDRSFGFGTVVAQSCRSSSGGTTKPQSSVPRRCGA